MRHIEVFCDFCGAPLDTTGPRKDINSWAVEIKPVPPEIWYSNTAADIQRTRTRDACNECLREMFVYVFANLLTFPHRQAIFERFEKPLQRVPDA